MQLSVSCNYRFLATISSLQFSGLSLTDWSLGSSDISLMLDISVWGISGKKKSRFGLVAEPSVAIIVILSMEIAGNVILMSVTTGSVAAPYLKCKTNSF